MKSLYAAELCRMTENDYPADSYNSWLPVCRLLENLGFNRWEAEAILRSKITRLARDAEGVRNGTSGTLKRYLDKNEITPGCPEVNRLVMKTFDGSMIGAEKLDLELNSRGVPCLRGMMPGSPMSGSTLVPLGTPNSCNPHGELYWAM